MALRRHAVAGALRPRVLCVDDDHDIGETVQEVLGDEGYDVICLFEITEKALRRAIEDLKPDCLLLDSSSRTDYGDSWGAAAWIRHLARAVPVVMFSAHLADSREAQANLSDRAQEAGFAAVLPKPFSIDQLLDAVSIAVARPRSLGLGEPEPTPTQDRRIAAGDPETDTRGAPASGVLRLGRLRRSAP